MWLDNDIKSSSTDKTAEMVSIFQGCEDMGNNHYARGKLSPMDRITSAMQIVADLLTPTRQCTNVAVFSTLPLPANESVPLLE